jgi:hypothetical protein
MDAIEKIEITTVKTAFRKCGITEELNERNFGIGNIL